MLGITKAGNLTWQRRKKIRSRAKCEDKITVVFYDDVLYCLLEAIEKN